KRKRPHRNRCGPTQRRGACANFRRSATNPATRPVAALVLEALVPLQQAYETVPGDALLSDSQALLPGSVRRGFRRYSVSTFPQALLSTRRWQLLCSCQSGISHLQLRARGQRLVPPSMSGGDVSVGAQVAVQGRAPTPG